VLHKSAEFGLTCLNAVLSSVHQESLPQQLGAELKIQIVDCVHPMAFSRTPVPSKTELSSSTSSTDFMEFLTIDKLCAHGKIVNDLFRIEHSRPALFFVQDLVD
jgi:hypothetical protein